MVASRVGSRQDSKDVFLSRSHNVDAIKEDLTRSHFAAAPLEDRLGLDSVGEVAHELDIASFFCASVDHPDFVFRLLADGEWRLADRSRPI